MATDTIVEKKDDFDLVAVFRAAAPETREQKFWITLGVALLLHTLILISLVHSAPKQMGDPKTTDGLSVSFVSEAELRDSTTGSDGGGATPAPQPTPMPTPPPQAEQPPEPPAEPPAEAQSQPPPPAPKPEAEPAEAAQPKAEDVAKADETKAPETPTLKDSLSGEVVPEKKAEETAAAKSTQEIKEKKEAKTEAEKPVETPHELTKERPDLLELPTTTAPQQPAHKQQPAKKQQQAMRQQPNLTMPQDSMSTPSYEGRSAGVQRPAGITRSGANDDFARGVIKALRKTMPQMNVLGRVTVKILINLNGNIESVEVVSRSENTDLNRAVVFSTKQASFPFPPNGATTDDRTFTITYIYH
jgi:TonB family protein